MSSRDAQTWRLGCEVLRALVELGDPQRNRWVSKVALGEKLEKDPDDAGLDAVARLLIETGEAETLTSALWLLRATPGGRSRLPEGRS